MVCAIANSLTSGDLELFDHFRIPFDLVSAAKVGRATDAQARDYGFRFSSGSNLAGVIFPYFDPITASRVTAG